MNLDGVSKSTKGRSLFISFNWCSSDSWLINEKTPSKSIVMSIFDKKSIVFINFNTVNFMICRDSWKRSWEQQTITKLTRPFNVVFFVSKFACQDSFSLSFRLTWRFMFFESLDWIWCNHKFYIYYENVIPQ